MGHTHYLNIAHPITDHQWERFITVCRAIFSRCADEHWSVALSDGEDGLPEASDLRVAVNGVGLDGCETLEIERSGGLTTWHAPHGPGWRFVKTNKRPYDDAVVAVLAVGKHLGILDAVDSDGARNDWAAGLSLARDATDEPIPLPFYDGEPDEDGIVRHAYGTMRVFGLTLLEVAALHSDWVRPNHREIQRAMDAILCGAPLGSVTLDHHGVVVDGQAIVTAIRCLLGPMSWVRLTQGKRPEVRRWDIIQHSDPTAAPTGALGDDAAVAREEKRLVAEDQGALVEALRHAHRRWMDHRVPAVRLLRGAVRP